MKPNLTKSEKIDILTKAYAAAKDQLEEIYQLLDGAHAEAEEPMDQYIRQELDPQYQNSLAVMIEKGTEEEEWYENIEEDEVEEEKK